MCTHCWTWLYSSNEWTWPRFWFGKYCKYATNKENKVPTAKKCNDGERLIGNTQRLQWNTLKNLATQQVPHWQEPHYLGIQHHGHRSPLRIWSSINLQSFPQQHMSEIAVGEKVVLKEELYQDAPHKEFDYSISWLHCEQRNRVG